MEFARLICRYAERFAVLGDGGHHVGSPLGAWLVLALAAPAADGLLRDQITDALGTDVESAHRLVIDLLERPPPAVSTALGAWTAPHLVGLNDWNAGLPRAVTSGPIPTQQQADAWAREHTLGLIDRFPLGMTDVLILLASTLASRVTWLRPFELVDGHLLGGRWGKQLTRVLRTDGEVGHDAFIATTQRAGDVAVHSALADHDLEVTSVIAAAEVAPADVLAVAHEIATTRAALQTAPSRSLFELPLGDGPLWTITEHEARARGEHVEAVLPAWHAESRHCLLDIPALALGAAGEALRIKAGVNGRVDAEQAAVATFTRRGFEAAAVTALGVTVSARRPPPPGRYRTATVRFAHPYAVVAASRAQPGDPWHGLPVFAAWVTDPDDAPVD